MIQRGIRGKDGNPILKPAVGPAPTIDEVKDQLRQMMQSPKSAPTTYPPMPDTTPPKQPSDPQNPPPLPTEEEEDAPEPEDEDGDYDVEDDNWEDQEEDEPVHDEAGRETYVPTGEFAQMRAEAMEPHVPTGAEKKAAALEAQRKADEERYGGKMGATVMEKARAAAPGAPVPQLDETRLHELATAKGYNADKMVRDSKRALAKWQAYADDIRIRAEEGDEVPQSELDEMTRLGVEAVKIPAMVLGIAPEELQRMLTDLSTPLPETVPQDASPEDAQKMYEQSLFIVNDSISKLEDPHKVLAAITGAAAVHILGFHSRDYRRKVITEHANHLLMACEEHEKEEDSKAK